MKFARQQAIFIDTEIANKFTLQVHQREQMLRKELRRAENEEMNTPFQSGPATPIDPTTALAKDMKAATGIRSPRPDRLTTLQQAQFDADERTRQFNELRKKQEMKRALDEQMAEKQAQREIERLYPEARQTSTSSKLFQQLSINKMRSRPRKEETLDAIAEGDREVDNEIAQMRQHIHVFK